MDGGALYRRISNIVSVGYSQTDGKSLMFIDRD